MVSPVLQSSELNFPGGPVSLLLLTSCRVLQNDARLEHSPPTTATEYSISEAGAIQGRYYDKETYPHHDEDVFVA